MRRIDVVVIGAGPYGLSLGAHLQSRGMDFRIFGKTMASWSENMPEGMLLKSYPWASSLSDPDSSFTVKKFCMENALPYDDTLMPLPVDSFISYGKSFQQRFVTNVENKQVMKLRPTASGIEVHLENDEFVEASHVVIAIGVTPFANVPAIANSVPAEFVSHSSAYGPLDQLLGKEVAVIGAGSSATNMTALLHERGIPVTLVGRRSEIGFAGTPQLRSRFQRMIAPSGGIGDGWTMGLCATAPWAIHMLPSSVRLRLAYPRALGPLGGAFMRDRVMGKVPMLLGQNLRRLDIVKDRIELSFGMAQRPLRVDHVVFATGYKTDLGRLSFLSEDMVAQMRRIESAPALSRHYESSIPGLHFIGPAATNSFGPVSRFVHGTPHPARHLAKYFAAILPQRRIQVRKAHGIQVAAVR